MGVKIHNLKKELLFILIFILIILPISAFNDSSLPHDFEIDYDNVSQFGFSESEKVYWQIEINYTNMTEDFNCISYVKTIVSNSSGQIIQTNPRYEKSEKRFISYENSYDDREFFPTRFGIGSVYFTKENLIFDEREYIFGVQCTGNNQKLNTEKSVLVKYKNIEKPLNSWVWGTNNLNSIFLGIIIIFFIIIFIVIIVGVFNYIRK